MQGQTTRRESLGLLGAAGLSALPGCGGTTRTPDAGASAAASGGAAGGGGAAPAACAAKDETTVGPFPTLSPLDRKDVRGNSSGVTTPKSGADITLRIRVLDLDAQCAPLAGAVVDIWQCDAVGAYASYAAFSTDTEDFLRGYQTTDTQGVAEFLTIFPGSYAGRALHIHFSIQGEADALPPNYQGQVLNEIFVAQLYFEPQAASEIFEAFPIYQQGAPITPNEVDGLFGSGGRDLTVALARNGNTYIGEVTVGVRRAEIGL